MSKKEKLLERLVMVPADFTWDELTTVLKFFGYKEFVAGKTGGSRRKFFDDNLHVIALHKPHPGKIVKKYALRQVIEILQIKGKINNE